LTLAGVTEGNARPDLRRPHPGVARTVARDDPGVREDVVTAFAGVLAVGLTIYLFVALFYPEKLQ
jgi:K+-transporting ATPase KdpF subunit